MELTIVLEVLTIAMTVAVATAGVFLLAFNYLAEKE